MRPSLDEARTMLLALLADRFQLRVHKEAREAPVFALVLAKKDGALGPGLRRSQRDCSAFSAATLNGDFNNEFRKEGCELVNRAAGYPGSVFRGSAAIPVLIPLISRGREIDRPIIDRTGLTGTFDIDFSYSPIRPGLRGQEIPVPPDGRIALHGAPGATRPQARIDQRRRRCPRDRSRREAGAGLAQTDPLPIVRVTFLGFESLSLDRSTLECA